MRKRNVHIQFWLDRKEAEHLQKLVKRSGLGRETYLRQLIRGVVPRDAMMRELYRIGNNLDQIAAKAHTLQVMDVQRYDEAVKEFRDAVRTITEAVVLPEKRK